MNRRNQILAGVLALQVILIAIVFWPGSGNNASAAALFPDLTVEDIQALTIDDGTQQIEVARSDGGWVLPAAGNYPANEVTVGDTISNVLQINTSRLIADDTSSHTRLEVTEDAAQRTVTLETTDGETLTLLVGSSPSFRSTNVRRGDNNSVYTTSAVQATDLRTDYANWIDTSYLAIPQGEVQSLTVDNAQDTLSFTKVSTDTWTLDDLAEGELFNQNNLNSLLTRFSGINMVRPLGTEAQPIYGMETPTATVTINHQPAGGAAETTLLIGNTLDDGNYVIKSSDSDYYVAVASFTVENILSRGRADYLQEPEVDEAAIDATGAITTTDFITDFSEITPTMPITSSMGMTGTEIVTGTAVVTP